MEIVETTLPGVGFDALIRSHRDGDLVVTIGGMVFVQWSARTLTALVRAPGRMRFGKDLVEVELDLQLPPMPHARIAEALCALDGRLRFEDGRALRARLAPRPRGSIVRGEVSSEE